LTWNDKNCRDAQINTRQGKTRKAGDRGRKTVQAYFLQKIQKLHGVCQSANPALCYKKTLLTIKLIVWHTYSQQVDWFYLEKGDYQQRQFPGLWLAAIALLVGNLAEVLQILQQGIGIAEHQTFVETLRSLAPDV
jgi:hypothetical protein